MLLAGDKGVSLPKLEQELLQVVQYGALQVRLVDVRVCRQSEELHDHGALHEREPLGPLRRARGEGLALARLDTARQHSLAVLAGYVSGELLDAPALAGGLPLVPRTGLVTLHAQELPIVCPSEENVRLSTCRVDNLREHPIELNVLVQARPRVTLSVGRRQLFGQHWHHLAAVQLQTRVPAQLLLGDAPA